MQSGTADNGLITLLWSRSPPPASNQSLASPHIISNSLEFLKTSPTASTVLSSPLSSHRSSLLTPPCAEHEVDISCWQVEEVIINPPPTNLTSPPVPTPIRLSSHDNLKFDSIIRRFVEEFKRIRTSLGKSQEEVGDELEGLCGRKVSQTTISRFETKSLSVRNMKCLVDLLNVWLVGHHQLLPLNFTRHIAHQLLSSSFRRRKRPRRKRTNLSNQETRDHLLGSFHACSLPSYKEVDRLRKLLSVEAPVIKSWFANTRQKLKRGGNWKTKDDDNEYRDGRNLCELSGLYTGRTQDTSSNVLASKPRLPVKEVSWCHLHKPVCFGNYHTMTSLPIITTYLLPVFVIQYPMRQKENTLSTAARAYSPHSAMINETLSIPLSEYQVDEYGLATWSEYGDVSTSPPSPVRFTDVSTTSTLQPTASRPTNSISIQGGPSFTEDSYSIEELNNLEKSKYILGGCMTIIK